MTGKLADSVMLVRNGEQLVRKYQPIVSNPSTVGQVAARAKLKALSQLSAVVAPYLAIPKQGIVSSRNLFTKGNYGNVTFATDTASINMPAIQLTSSNVFFPAVNASRNATQARVIDLAIESGANEFDKVVYVAIERTADNKLRNAGSAVVTVAGTNRTFNGYINVNTLNEVTVLAYGVRDNTDAARVKYGNLESLTATYVASLVADRVLTEADVTITETRGVGVPASE